LDELSVLFSVNFTPFVQSVLCCTLTPLWDPDFSPTAWHSYSLLLCFNGPFSPHLCPILPYSHICDFPCAIPVPCLDFSGWPLSFSFFYVIWLFPSFFGVSILPCPVACDKTYKGHVCYSSVGSAFFFWYALFFFPFGGTYRLSSSLPPFFTVPSSLSCEMTPSIAVSYRIFSAWSVSFCF